MRRFHEPDLPAKGEVWLEGDEGRHLARVLRARPGDAVALFDGRGREARCVVEAVERDRVRLRIDGELDPLAAGRELTLCTAVPKGRRMEWLVEKAVECGVARVFPVAFAHGERHRVGETNLRRWRRAALEAAKQCGRADVPDVRAPAELADVLAAVSPARVFVADPTAAEVPSFDADAPAALFVGPEGGIREDERAALGAAGATPLGLGDLILRVETAAIVACHRLVW